MSYNPNVPDFDNIAYDDLQKMKENFQILANIATRREDILSLAVETGDILDSRIVEHNLNILSPSNGYYVRWENGLQVCISGYLVGIAVDPGSYAYYDWTPPAQFVEFYAVLMVPHTAGGDMSMVSQTYGVLNLDTRAVLRNNSDAVRSMYPHFIAIGRWK